MKPLELLILLFAFVSWAASVVGLAITEPSTFMAGLIGFIFSIATGCLAIRERLI